MTWQKWLLVISPLVLTPVAGCAGRVPDEAAKTNFSSVLELDNVVPVRRSRITESLELVGTLFPWRSARIASEVDGVIRRVPMYEKELEYEIDGQKFSQPIFLDIGHPVKEGAVLVEIDERPFQLKLAAAKAKLNLVAKELANLMAWKRPEEVAQFEAQRDEADAQLDRARLDLNRCEELCEKNVVSESERDATVAAYKTALAAKRRAEAAVNLAEEGPTPEQIDVAQAQLDLAQTEVALRQDDLDKCTLYCPYDAVIVDRYVGVGDRVTATPRVEIMQIIDPSILFAQVSVPEKYQGLVRVSDEATVRAPGVSEPELGVVGLVNEKIDPETRTFRVRVGVKNPKRIFKAGLYVRVTLSLASSSDALVVPSEAMTFEEGQPAVFVLCGDHVEKRGVTLGVSNGREYEIKPKHGEKAVQEGEQVVVGGTSLLTDGIRVRLKGAGPSPEGVTQDSSLRGGEPPRDREAGLSLAAENVGAQP